MGGIQATTQPELRDNDLVNISCDSLQGESVEWRMEETQEANVFVAYWSRGHGDSARQTPPLPLVQIHRDSVL